MLSISSAYIPVLASILEKSVTAFKAYKYIEDKGLQKDVWERERKRERERERERERVRESEKKRERERDSERESTSSKA